MAHCGDLCHKTELNINEIIVKKLKMTYLGSKVFFKWAYSSLFLFIFVHFKHKLYRKTIGFSGIQTRIVGVEGEHADLLTTTTAQGSKVANLIDRTMMPDK